MHSNILTTRITARRDFEAQYYTHLIQNCLKERINHFDSIHVPKSTTVKDAISFKLYFESLLAYKSSIWVTDDRIISWIDQATRSTRNARLEEFIEENKPTATASENLILWVTIYAIAVRQAAKRSKPKSYTARVANASKEKNPLGDAWLDYTEFAAEGLETFGAEAAVMCYFMWQTCPTIMTEFAQTSNSHLEIGTIRIASLEDYLMNMPTLVARCKAIDILAFESEMTWYLARDESASEITIKPLRSATQMVRPFRDTISYKFQNREVSSPRYQGRESTTQNTVTF